jgi:pimeloyl-ACP methyl ester carboxylesterase
MDERHVEVEGINYYTLYELPDSQEKNAPCILLVHAIMSNLHMYDSTVKVLHKAGFATLRYDHVGHHNTPPPQTSTTERRMSISGQLAYHMDDLTRHMHQLVKERTGQTHLAAVIGCSIGGMLALRYGMMFPQDVDQIISVASPGIVFPEDMKHLWSGRIKQFEEDQQNGTDKLCHATVERWFPGGPEDDGVRAESLKHVKSCSMQGYKLLADTIRNYDYADELHTYPIEGCLIVAGTEDGAISLESLEFIASYIQGSQLVKMEGAGHLPPMHKPKEFGEIITGFLQR